MTAPPQFKQHPERAAIQAEAHARPPLGIKTKDAEIWHWVLVEDDEEDEQWPEAFDPVARHQVIETEDGLIRFERHTEFVSLTYMGSTAPVAKTASLIAKCPGRQLAGLHIVLREKLGDTPAQVFENARLFGGTALFDGVTVTTDFSTGPNAVVRYVVGGIFEDEHARGRLVKRLIDIETYRMASLLGLPIVRREMPHLQELEARATEATASLMQDGEPDLGAAIDKLAVLLSDIGALRAATRYRIAASAAYYDIVAARLNSLDERPVGQRQTMRGFIEHRLSPAIHTIQAFDRRLEDVAGTVSSAMALARTRLDHVAQAQNQKLLASMERRAHQQVLLSQAVEGLSVAAITYYLVGLVGTLMKSLPELPISAALVQALSIPVIAITVWVNVRRTKSHLDKL